MARYPRIVRRLILWIVLGVVVLFGLMQLVPYGRNHGNPPVTKEVAWDTARTRELAVGACYDCHSNLTTWPWYSNVAPASWLVYADVKSGRETLNFSEWDKPQGEGASEAVEAVRSGSMPPFQYKPLHPAGRLTSAEREELARGLEKTLAADPPTRRSPAPDSEGGRGIRPHVRRGDGQWGSGRDAGVNLTWFELDLPLPGATPA